MVMATAGYGYVIQKVMLAMKFLSRVKMPMTSFPSK